MPYNDTVIEGEIGFERARIAALEVNAATAKGKIDLDILSAITLAAGIAVSAAAPTGSVPGTAIADTHSAVVKWLAHATPAALCLNAAVPADLDDSKAVVFHAHLSKSGATSGDATALTVVAYEVVPGAAHDADSDFGGDSTAIVGTATAKTVTEVTLTFLADNIHAYAETIALQIKPKAGLLGTDNLYLHSAWLEYTQKPLLS